MVWIEPFSFETIIINIFAGDIKYFTALALIVITGMAGYFRMIGLTLMFMLVIFFAMFKNYVDQSLFFLLVSLGGLLVGYWISQIVKR